MRKTNIFGSGWFESCTACIQAKIRPEKVYRLSSTYKDTPTRVNEVFELDQFVAKSSDDLAI